MAETPDVTKFAESLLPLIQRFTGNQPDALKQIRAQVQNELEAGRQMVDRATAQLAALDQFEALIGAVEADEPNPFVPAAAPPMKKAILAILDENPERQWHRDELYSELIRRGWGPGGKNPRNTFTARLRDLELEKPPKVQRIGQDGFQIARGGEPD